jgi:hypothetical protein
VKVVNSFSVEKQERFFKRMALMDDYMIKQYLEKPDSYISNFEVGGKYNMLVVKQNIANCSFCEIELPIVFSN